MSYSLKFVEEVYPPPLLPGFLVEGKIMMAFLKQSPRETLKPCSRQAVSADSTLLFGKVYFLSYCSRLKHSAMRISTARLE